jgi:5-methylcytosine-specific restriction endonuclease McrA
MTKPCLDCGALTKGSRCSHCQARREADEWTSRRRIRSGWDWGKLRDAVRARDRVCVRCGGSDRLQVHHRVPLAERGTNTLDNLELVCRPCHEAAHATRASTVSDATREEVALAPPIVL